VGFTANEFVALREAQSVFLNNEAQHRLLVDTATSLQPGYLWFVCVVAPERNANHKHTPRVLVSGALLSSRDIGQAIAVDLGALSSIGRDSLDIRWWSCAAGDKRQQDDWQY